MGLQSEEYDAKPHRGDIEGGNSTVQSLHRTVADQVLYLGQQAPVSEIISKLELLYGTVASIDILMQFFFINYNKGRQRKGQYM